MRSTDKCDMKHSENEFRSSNGVGENLFWVNDPSGQPPTVFARNIEGLRSFVHKECSAFVREMNFGKGGFGGDTNAYGHLSQLLWGPSTNVGCATCVSGEDVLSICHYASPGNMGGSNILGERV
ncbi:hypothetical protein BC829DRAFT_406876 [Chytridium lagenaria]|nr:hypothetical protein BC829DRAFT_406876 [Chytridium lagenaria]